MASSDEIKAIRDFQRQTGLGFQEARQEMTKQTEEKGAEDQLRGEVAALRAELTALRALVDGIRVTGPGHSGQGPTGLMFSGSAGDDGAGGSVVLTLSKNGLANNYSGPFADLGPP